MKVTTGCNQLRSIGYCGVMNKPHELSQKLHAPPQQRSIVERLALKFKENLHC